MQLLCPPALVDYAIEEQDMVLSKETNEIVQTEHSVSDLKIINDI